MTTTNTEAILQKCGFETVCEIELLEDMVFSQSRGAG